MPILNIAGRKIRVGDEFLALSPEDQQQTVEEIARGFGGPTLPRGHDVPEYDPGIPGYNPKTGMVERESNAPRAAAMGAADGASFGYGDEALAAGIAAIENIRPGGSGASYDDVLHTLRKDQRMTQDANPLAYGAGQIAGGVGSAVAAAPITATGKAIQAGRGLGGLAKAGAIDGAIMGGLSGSGSGTDAESRLRKGAVGWAGGLGLGAVAPYAVAGASATISPLASALLSRAQPQTYANRALSAALTRSGSSADDVAEQMLLAHADDQPMFTVADALGHTGGRALSTVTRTPNDARQRIVDAILGRQMDQGRRVASAFGDASGTPLTAQQYQRNLETLRASEAERNYRPVRQEIAPIDVSEPVARANAAISPAADQLARAQGAVSTDLAARQGIERGEAVLRDPIREAVSQARSYLAAPTLTATNVQQAFRAKVNIDTMIANATEKGQGATVAVLMPIRDALDDRLAATSANYANARGVYRDASNTIDAIGAGREMASGRTRIDDNLARFNELGSDEAQAAARVGYFDPKIAKAEKLAGTMSNAARPYISESARQELPAFAAPGTGPQLMRRLGREQTMAETTNAALGGSRTAENLADMADVGQNAADVIMSGVRGGATGMVMTALTRALNEGRGLPPSVLTRLGDALMETNPQTARGLLSAAQQRGSEEAKRRAITAALLSGAGASALGRLAP